MQPELFDLLQEAKADAPPPRYGVEDAVAAGRRLRRRQRAGWAIAAAAAVVAAIGVPSIVTRSAAPVPRPVVGETPAAGPWPFNFTFRGYVAAGFRVDDPSSVDLGSDTAVVHRLGVPPTGGAAGRLRVFHPGVDPSGDFRGRTLTPADPIGGRPAFYAGSPADLWWEYAQGQYAVLTAGSSSMSRAQMHQVAAAFTLGVTRPALIGFAISHLPANYVLVEAHGIPTGPGQNAVSGATFVLASAAKAMAAQPDRGVPPEDRDNPDYSFKISLARWTSSYPKLNERGVTCPAGAAGHALTCYRLIDLGRDGDYVLTATWAGTTTAPLSRALTSTRLAALYDESTWWGVNVAFPAAAQLPG